MYIVYSVDSDLNTHVVYFYSDYTEAKNAYDTHYQQEAFSDDDEVPDSYLGFALIKIPDGSGFTISEDAILYFNKRFEVIEYSEGEDCKLSFIQS